jgi:hypothetical protein
MRMKSRQIEVLATSETSNSFHQEGKGSAARYTRIPKKRKGKVNRQANLN